MTSFTHRGPQHRTKLLTIEQAAAFARCLRGNDRFTGIEIQESTTAKSEDRKWFVTFLPSSGERYAAMVNHEQDARQQRAEGEGADYAFILDDSRRFWWVWNPKSGETYETCEHNCTCPDWHFRLQGTGLKCKHQLALQRVAV